MFDPTFFHLRNSLESCFNYVYSKYKFENESSSSLESFLEIWRVKVTNKCTSHDDANLWITVI